ncbi:hypothetical protein ACLB2K_048163 [Fragaria x ananassa]
MALRAAYTGIGRQRHSCLLSVPRYLQLQAHLYHSAAPPQRLTSFPIHQSGFKFGIRAISEAAANPITPKKENERESAPENWKIKMLYDGDCPLCMREVNMLRERNKSYGTIKFVDISSEDYSPEDNLGLDYKTVMGNIHAILSDGTVVTDVEIGTIAGAVYSVWAKYRLQITGRPPLEEVLELRKKIKVSNYLLTA